MLLERKTAHNFSTCSRNGNCWASWVLVKVAVTLCMTYIAQDAPCSQRIVERGDRARMSVRSVVAQRPSQLKPSKLGKPWEAGALSPRTPARKWSRDRSARILQLMDESDDKRGCNKTWNLPWFRKMRFLCLVFMLCHCFHSRPESVVCPFAWWEFPHQFQSLIFQSPKTLSFFFFLELLGGMRLRRAAACSLPALLQLVHFTRAELRDVPTVDNFVRRFSNAG